MEERKSSYIDKNVNWCHRYGKQFAGSLEKLKIELPHDPALSLLGIFSEKNMAQKGICTPVFTEALFTVAKTWKQPKCPLIEEWIKKVWDVYYTVEHYSAIKNEVMTFAAAWTDLEIIILSKVSHTKKDKYHMIWFIWRIKNDTNEFVYKRETDSQT